MQKILKLLIVSALLALAACDASGRAEGDSSADRTEGHVEVGVPF